MVDLGELVKRAVKYLVEGLMVAIAAYAIPKRSLNMDEVCLIALTAAATTGAPGGEMRARAAFVTARGNSTRTTFAMTASLPTATASAAERHWTPVAARVSAPKRLNGCRIGSLPRLP